MKKFQLYVMTAGERNEKPIVCNGFVEAEKKAKELYGGIYKDYPGDDTYIECVESEFDLNFDHLIWQQDCFGDIYWRKIVCKDWLQLYAELLEDYEKDELQEWREEEDRHIEDLSEEELKDLRSQITVGSGYLSDYSNSFFIDEDEVLSACDRYDDWLEDEHKDDTQQNFANYIIYNY